MIVLDCVVLFNKLADDVDLDLYTRQYCLGRIACEGVGFLTDTLPKLSKAVLESLELGYFKRPLGLQWKGRSLRYFRSLLNGIFDRNGNVLAAVDEVALWRLRQLCEYFYKLAVPYTVGEQEKAYDRFLDNERELVASPINEKYVDQLRKDFETYFKPLSRAHAHQVMEHNRPRPGSGTYAGSKGDKNWFLRKENLLSVPRRLAAFSGYFKPYPAAPTRIEFGEDTSDKSEVLLVPKDSRGPRVIVREPFLRLSLQMAFHDWMKGGLERLTDNRVNFQNQQVNRDLAALASKTKEWATIDLKDASDRVDYLIMARIFRNSPACRFFLQNRTREAIIPGKGTIQLRKVAGMGSGLTFPLMSLLIYLCICRSICDKYRLPYRTVMKYVYVYGDDIVVPSKYFCTAVHALSLVKLKANTEKSFVHSLFRESCGGDYYNGQYVAPVRLKLSSSAATPSGYRLTFRERNFSIVELNAHAAECVRGGLLGVSELLYKIIEAEVGPLPSVSGETSVIGRWASCPPTCYKVDEFGQYATVRVLTVQPKRESWDTDPYVYLSRSLRVGNPLERDRNLGYYDPDDACSTVYGEVTVPRRVELRRRKVSAYSLI